MNALDRLSAFLAPANATAAGDLHVGNEIDRVLDEISRRWRGRADGDISRDRQLEAIRRFWESREVQSFRDAYLLSWGLSLPHERNGKCILEDQNRLEALLAGVDQWRNKPTFYRRCYRGLVSSYFTYDGPSLARTAAARKSWEHLRGYLFDRNSSLGNKSQQPDWVDLATHNRRLFTEEPYAAYVEELLRGDTRVLDQLSEQLGISQASWFLRELVLAQIRHATTLDDARFKGLIPILLALLEKNLVLRDRGMISVLDRYAEVPGHALRADLRDRAIEWWGNPWLPSNASTWGGVRQQTRSMVADWLKLEFIETFFTKLADDGLGDPRRMNFWKRYIKSIDHIEFALGSFARYSRDPDFVVLRKKMTGLIASLDAPGTNNAFIMHMGPLVAVEFSGAGNAFYAYRRNAIPFDTSEKLGLRVDGQNSLKHSMHLLKLTHMDGGGRWENDFESRLRHHGLQPFQEAVAPGEPVRTRGTDRGVSNPSSPFSRVLLMELAREHALEIDDRSNRGGAIWVRVERLDSRVQQTLEGWGFQYSAGKGWWKS